MLQMPCCLSCAIHLNSKELSDVNGTKLGVNLTKIETDS